MKIIPLSILCLATILVGWVYAFETPTCDYVGSGAWLTGEAKANYIFQLELCELQRPLDQESYDQIYQIHTTSGKSARELIYDLGNTFCQGYYGKCDETSLYARYLQTCNTAREKALASDTWLISIGSSFLLDSYTKCTLLATNKLSAYRESGVQEVAHNIQKTIEDSVKVYTDASHKKMDTFSNVMQTFLKKIGSIARSIEGFIWNVYQ